ncbi:helix-turn-helix domain-containing protein [Chryseobacterium jejuense]|uniref:AraC-type DNA-binding protein n=1 Tax=Chryseobacterium jejuense TaxID=445960 RepID=A0A2X2VEA2_CHRJE|nr:helix-turn-helix domain-containing protein [Chryseobacterium jejuense]SDI37608.1 AraC-type DNA-binding protein [Chryseobacterium jejuense]SQB26878.1 L-rhamnose operon regulatory protein rhaS [Chryseobacterium jejuense]
MTKPIIPLLTMQEVHRLFDANILSKPELNFGKIFADHAPFLLLEVVGNNKESIVFRAEYNALVLCVSGTCDKEVGMHSFKMKPKSIHWVKAGQLQSFNNQTEDVHCFILCFYTHIWKDFPVVVSTMEQLLNLEYDQVPNFNLDDHTFDQIFELYQKIDREQRQKASFYTAMSGLFILEILYLIKRSSLQAFTKDKEKKTSAQQDKWLAFKRLVEEHFQTHKSVKEYANQLNISPKYLNEIVNRETGSSPMKHIQQRILAEARYLLAYTDLSVKEIAYLLQFESSAYFGKFFRARTGSSPSVFRQERK